MTVVQSLHHDTQVLSSSEMKGLILPMGRRSVDIAGGAGNSQPAAGPSVGSPDTGSSGGTGRPSRVSSAVLPAVVAVSISVIVVVFGLWLRATLRRHRSRTMRRQKQVKDDGRPSLVDVHLDGATEEDTNWQKMMPLSSEHYLTTSFPLSRASSLSKLHSEEARDLEAFHDSRRHVHPAALQQDGKALLRVGVFIVMPSAPHSSQRSGLDRSSCDPLQQELSLGLVEVPWDVDHYG